MTEPGAPLEALDLPTCYGLLRSVEIGRIAVAPAGEAPLVVPVTYAVVDAQIVFRSAAGTKLAALRDGPASFEVDVIDSFHRVGWSVLVRGVVEEIEPDDELALQPWMEGDLRHWLRLVPELVTGRRLVLPAAGDGGSGRGYA